MKCIVKDLSPTRSELEMGFSAVLTQDEVAYLGLHVARLVADLRG